jgi:signal transduction histidine kinase
MHPDMKQFILVIFFFVCSFSLIGQVKTTALENMHDSLKNELKGVIADSVKMEILILLAESSNYRDPDSSIYYGEKALKLAKKLKDIPAQMGAMAFISSALRNQGNLPKALELGLEAAQIGKDLPVRLAGGIGPIYSNLGEIYFEINDFVNAVSYFRKMSAIGENDLAGVAYGFYDLARVKVKLNQLDSARYFLKRSYDTFAKLEYSYYPKIYHVYPPWYNLRAQIFLKENQPDSALTDIFTSLKMTLRSGDNYHISNNYIDIALFYEKYNQPDSVIFYAKKGINTSQKISHSRGILDASEILARQFESSDPEKALSYYKLATQTRNKLYGAGNIQVIRDMIEQEARKQADIEAAKIAFQNQIKINSILGIAFTLLGFAIFLFIIFKRKQKAKQKIESAFNQLKATQTRLIQSEKMASLGELTAGIAHEIQNPLNFVNNFSEVNRELIAELKEELDNGDFEEAKVIARDIEQNEEKINHHGKRADGIVKGMLQHSRSSSGQKEPVDINSLADEYLRLAYHGFRAKDNTFNADFKLDADGNLPKVNIVPQDIGRVLLNLINNAFYAVSEKAKEDEEAYKPLVLVSTKNLENNIEIKVTDNGHGISQAVLDKIFQPFFTTKPTGEGTGLGLSLSYDIITKGHGGEIKVETNHRQGSEFIIVLPV